jgi:cysteine-rich repeat protein
MRNRHIRRLQQAVEFTSGDNIITKSFDLSSMLRGYRSASSDDTSYSGGGGAKKVTPNTDDATSSVVTPDCALSSAYWITSSVTEGSSARLTALSTNCDNGTPVTYIIKKKEALLGIDWLWPDSVSYIIEDNSFSTLWTAGLKQDDSSSTGNYYFIATANSTSAESGLLEVTGVVTPAVCGNSATETGEGCDDGNTTDGDGCSSTCAIEVIAGYTSSITQYGITWTLDGQYQYGQFANGDYWVLGPVTIISITPDFDGSHHGWMANMDSTDQSYDSRALNFDASLVPPLPYIANGGESIVKSISTEPLDAYCRPCLRTAAVLTVLDTAPESNGANIFRPSYFGTDKTLYSINDVNMNLLPSLTPPAGYEPETFDWITERYKRLQLDVNSYPGELIGPYENMCSGGELTNGCSYGGRLALANGDFALRLMLNDSIDSKREHVVYYVQHGIDLYHTMLSGMSWELNGGHGNGRKLPIILTAILLENDTWKQNILAEPDNTFQEDDATTFSRVANDGAGQVLFGVGTVSYWMNVVTDTSSRTSIDPYGYIDGSCIPGTSYQRGVNSMIWKGPVIAQVIMSDVADLWNGTDLLAYVDRWVEFGTWAQPDVCAPAMGVCVGGVNDGSECTYADENACAGGYCAGGLCDEGTYDGQYCGVDGGPSPNNNCEDGRGCRIINPVYYGVTYGPDPLDSSKCILDTDLSDGVGRFPFRHGEDADTGGYHSLFVNAMWDAYRSLTPSTFIECTLDTDCNDDLYCNGTELCLSGRCSIGTSPCLEDSYTCTTATCNDTTDNCGISYDDAVCNDSNTCTDDTCIGTGGDATTGCQITNNTSTCDDGYSCTDNDICSMGVCGSGDVIDCELSTLSDGLIAHYLFNGNADDDIISGNNGTLVGGTSLTTGISGQGYAFDGDGDYIALGQPDTFDFSGYSGFTISAWVNSSDSSQIGQVIFARGGTSSGSAATAVDFRYNTSALRPIIQIGNGVGTIRATFGSDQWSNNEWHFVIARWDGVNLSICIDGSSNCVVTVDSEFGSIYNAPTTRDTSIGAESRVPRNYFNGTIDEVRIYNRALSSDEVLELYNLHNIAYLPNPDNIGFFTKLAMGWFR